MKNKNVATLFAAHKNAHREKAPSNKTPALTISINIGILEAVVQSCFVKKVLIQMRLWHWCFPVYFAKFLRTTFFIEHL